ncbi:hypothetical protein OG871_40145 (plasmid) [Kitasatospora sp. NBC_00374]|uniref:hypothetical protein n=1 Tax=Kitasatospora sp. NBC_00374 TaxID=2975964 RepID=UPI002F908D01
MQYDRVGALRYAVAWSDQHPLSWLEGAFPVTYEVSGWKFELAESRLVAVPPTPMDLDDAREAVLPLLNAWAASLEIDDRLLVTFSYLGADVVSGRSGQVQAADAVVAAFDATVAVQRPSPPAPSWDWLETSVTGAARALCLRPLRSGNRPVVDAAYWLATHLAKWAGSETEAAARLNVSADYMKRARTEGARSDERKVGPGSKTLTAEEKVALARVVEELVRRLHLVESTLSPGEYLTMADWPA